LTKCPRCGNVTWDSKLWQSETIMTEFNGKFLCLACREGKPIEPANKIVSETVLTKTPMKEAGSMMFALAAITLLISAALVLIPSMISIGNASDALNALGGYYDGSTSAVQNVYYMAVAQFVGLTTLFGFLGIVLYQLHEKELL
jgi:hypothetical protein